MISRQRIGGWNRADIGIQNPIEAYYHMRRELDREVMTPRTKKKDLRRCSTT